MNNSTDKENDMVTIGSDDVVNVSSIPLPLFLIMSILAFIGFSYSIALLCFNVVHRKKKIVKMTSPNVNVVILIGCCIAFIVIALLGFSSPTIPQHIVSTTLQACVFLLPLSFTMVYGSLFAKVIRIHMIFTNLSFNGKSTRDEHLLLSVVALMLLDLAILLPWQLIDPITCHSSTWKTADENVTYIAEECSSELQIVWISVIYAYKVVMLSCGVYFTWQTRFVTLPSIRDARLIFVAVQSVALLAITVLPILLVTNESSVVIKYSVGSLSIWFSLMTTITLLFIPKVRLLRMEMRMTDVAAAETNSMARMQFSESMTKTKNAAAKCGGGGGGGRSCFFFCCCVQSTTDDNEDRYAQEILATEIETLKRTIKEKDLTIRELTDRLYIGTEKFHQYLTTKTKRFDDEFVSPQPRVISQHRCNGNCHEHPTTRSHCHHTPGEECPSAFMSDCRCRNTGFPATAAMVNDPRQRIQPIGPRRPLDDRREELRNYRLSRYYREDEEDDEDGDDDYDSRSYSDLSCSTCAAAAEIMEMQMRDAELQRRRTQAAADDGPRELSAATLSFSYAEAHSYAHRGGGGGAGVRGAGGEAGVGDGRGGGGGGVGGVVQTVHRSTPWSTAASMPLHPRNPPGASPLFQPTSMFRPVDQHHLPHPSSSAQQDSAYDNSTPSSTESATAELIINPSRRPRLRPSPNRSIIREERTVEVHNVGDHMDRQIVGVFSVHRPPTGGDSVTVNVSLEGIKKGNNPMATPTATLTSTNTMAGDLSSSSTDHQTQTTCANNGQGHTPPSRTNHGLHDTCVLLNQQIQINEQLNPSTISVQVHAVDPMTSNVISRNESSSIHPISIESNDADADNNYTMHLTTDSRYEMNTEHLNSSSDGRLGGIRTFGLMTVTQI